MTAQAFRAVFPAFSVPFPAFHEAFPPLRQAEKLEDEAFSPCRVPISRENEP